MGLMRIAIASDVHGLWYSLEYAEADILVMAGDLFDYYAMDRKQNAREQLSEVKQFNLFLEHYGAKYKKIIIIGGNHDFVFQEFPKKSREILTNATLLQDESCEFGGFKFYGSPWQPYFGGWAFNFKDHNIDFQGSREQARKCWAQIPSDTDILITHSPPLYILDKTSKGQNKGCQYLAERLEELPNLAFHAFGHVHASRGHLVKDGLLRVNASNSRKHDSVDYPMYVVEISEDGIARVIHPSHSSHAPPS
jgi:Icc-related predicted phosphoesterase